MRPENLLQKARELIDRYDHVLEQLEKKQEMTDDLIDEILGAEADSVDVLHSLILAKKVHADRRSIADREEKKVMQMINRIMRRARIENFESEDGKLKGKIAYRFEIKDESLIPEELKAPVWMKINSLVQKGETIPGVEKGEGFLDVRLY